MSPKYDSVPAEPQLPARPRASTVAEAETRPAAAPAPVTPKRATEDLVTITVAIPRDVRQALKVACAVNGVTVQHATAEAFRMWLAVHGTTQDH